MKKFALILAGGKGTRLWPISIDDNPKQLLTLISANPMIVDTINRIKENFNNENIFIITSAEQSKKISSLLNNLIPKENVIVEPISRGTAACILYAIMKIKTIHGNGIISIFASDHYIGDDNKWNKIISKAMDVVSKEDAIVTIGIKPRNPNIEYGYILKGKKIENGVYWVKKFTEKPSKSVAIKYIESNKYLWNSGNFIAKLSFLISLYKQLMPNLYEQLFAMQEKNFDKTFMKENYYLLENTSIDYAILENTDKIISLETDIFWSDVGTLYSLSEIVAKDDNQNYSNNGAIFKDSNNNFVYSSSKSVAIVGIENCVLIENDGVIVLTSKDKVNEIKDLMSIIRTK